MNDLDLKSYFYELPKELIAQRPCEPRDHSRLLVYKEETDEIIHTHFHELPKFLPDNADLVLNNSRVFPCRLLGAKPSGGKVEVFLLSKKPNDEGLYPCLLKSNGKKRIGDEIIFSDDLRAVIEKSSTEGGHQISLSGDLEAYLESEAKVPIPPYIRGGESDDQDKAQYQTTYASDKEEDEGSVAAPTAGLHFTPKVFSELSAKGIHPHYVTLHVGLGTFLPVKTDNILEHKMHSESYYVDGDHWPSILNSSYRVAVGTTSLRVLESLWSERQDYIPGTMKDTDIFLHPGVEVESIDALITNFHLPESTLLMLVSSLIGREKTMELYDVAVREKYRFFSYGDAMLILRKPRKDS